MIVHQWDTYGCLLDQKFLRMKVLVLWAVALMLRPSDIAPKSVLVGDFNCRLHDFTLGQVVPLDNGSLEIKFLGTKNDYQ